ncbi:hypothetical protein M0R45_025734 [Rubus argutus]|uniref:Uncharacterized protein n=1 Tax=Rubus argutus TaxID=59490 RepID=A0AAW1WX57_RUBAR
MAFEPPLIPENAHAETIQIPSDTEERETATSVRPRALYIARDDNLRYCSRKSPMRDRSQLCSSSTWPETLSEVSNIPAGGESTNPKQNTSRVPPRQKLLRLWRMSRRNYPNTNPKGSKCG